MHVLGMFRACVGHVFGMFWVCFGHVVGYVLGMFWACFWGCFGDDLGMFWGCLWGLGRFILIAPIYSEAATLRRCARLTTSDPHAIPCRSTYSPEYPEKGSAAWGRHPIGFSLAKF